MTSLHQRLQLNAVHRSKNPATADSISEVLRELKLVATKDVPDAMTKLEALLHQHDEVALESI